MSELPELYFRIRENGAAVFRMDNDAHTGRIEMTQIATVNLPKNNTRVHGDIELSAAEQTAIDAWISDRKETLEWRRLERVLQTVEDINLTSQWVQSQASAEDLSAVANPLFLAMHDLRQALVRKAAENAQSEDD